MVHIQRLSLCMVVRGGLYRKALRNMDKIGPNVNSNCYSKISYVILSYKYIHCVSAVMCVLQIVSVMNVLVLGCLIDCKTSFFNEICDPPNEQCSIEILNCTFHPAKSRVCSSSLHSVQVSLSKNFNNNYVGSPL